jgi:hypothetical protein
MINLSRVTDRTLLVLLSSSVGGVASMAALRILHEWAFRTEFNRWLWLTAVHSCIVFVLFAMSFDHLRPSVLGAEGIAKCIGAVVFGGLTSLFATPFGFVLIMSGQAFITSGVATLIYVAASALPEDHRINPSDP